jgi:arylsulfatase A-like enzyme
MSNLDPFYNPSMNKVISYKLSFGLSLFLFIIPLCKSNSQQFKNPNIIIVLSDDQGYGDFSAHGNPILETPALDKLANESIQLTDFHVAPLCTPTRGQLMTGLDAYHNKASTVLHASNIVRRDVVMIPELLERNGYSTGIFGKWHLGDTYPDRPMDNGFQKSIWHKGWGLLSEIEYDNDYYETRYLDSLTIKFSGKYCTNLWFDKAMEWMDEKALQNKPFFTYIALNAPHGPFDSPKQDYDVYKDKVDNDETASFLGMIRNIDRNMNRLENWLESRKLKKNTIVIYMTDNGTAKGEKVFNANMRGKKGSIYEGGHRAACFIRWPDGKLIGPLKIDTPTQVQDILPTILELCTLKEEQKITFDGQSLLPLLYSKDKFLDRMFVVQQGSIESTKKHKGTVVWQHWRLVGANELFNIQEDPSQKNNVANDFPKIFNKMSVFYENWWNNLHPEINHIVPIFIGAQEENPVIINSNNWKKNAVNTQWGVAMGKGPTNGGISYLNVTQKGTYKIELSRWPFHLDKNLNSVGPEFSIGGNQINTGKAFEIDYGCMVIGSQNIITQKTLPNSKSIVFETVLEEGETQFKAWFQDKNKNNVCGAYYVRFTKI